EAGRAALSSALERMEDSAAQRLEIPAREGAPLLAKLEPWSGGDGLVLLAPLDREAVATPVVADAGVDRPEDTFAETDAALAADHIHEAGDDGGESSMRDAFRRTLVELMLASVDAWERATGTGRLEFAEKSRIWRVNIDDGRLRARALERYLSLSKLPRNPRWRDVLRSAYFVLGRGEELPAETRAVLQSRVDAVLAYTRRDALV
ncbi:hypothetical protein AB4084_10655, partial [Lysobacter sp. 2RAB21]